METVNAVLIILFGLAWGSFLNVVIYRLPRGLNLATPPSACPGCGKRIRPWDNVPVLSFLILRGKCRFCGFHIPVSYFLVEVLTPAALVLVFRHHGSEFAVPFFASGLFASAMIVLAFIDYHHGVLPDAITLPGTLLALGYGVFRTDMGFRQALIGAVVGSAFLFAVYGAYLLIRRQEGLGMGDVTMMLVIGAYLGWPRTILTLILASFSGAVIGIFLIVVRKKDMQTALPFGTFLAPAAFIALLWGERIIRAYLSLYRR
jgi:leader peptidase (prepilin peptidase) / N-methyltransferase